MKNPSLLSALLLLLAVVPACAFAADPPKENNTQKVLGIGGLFFRSENPGQLAGNVSWSECGWFGPI
jgi:hypothetical protein